MKAKILVVLLCAPLLLAGPFLFDKFMGQAKSPASGQSANSGRTESESNSDAVITAIMHGDSEKLQTLLENGLDPNMPISSDRPDVRALHFAAISKDNPEIIRLLVTAKAELNRRSESGVSPLFAAITYSNSRNAQELIALGADVNTSNSVGCTALEAAVSFGPAEVVKALVAHGADVNQQKTRRQGLPLTVAVREDDLAMARLLLQLGADPTLIDLQGKRALDHAISDPMRELLQGAVKAPR